MMKHGLGLLLMALMLVSSGCGLIYSRSTSVALERDLSLLYGEPGFTDSAPGCTVIDSTRTGFCLYETSEAEVATLVDRLGLHSVVIDENGAGSSVVPEAEASSGCLSQSGYENPRRLVIYESERRADAIQLENGTAFEYLMVMFEPVRGGMCIQASYAYG
jgi:hypothetical protein